jgi:hypothetical protein
MTLDPIRDNASLEATPFSILLLYSCCIDWYVFAAIYCKLQYDAILGIVALELIHRRKEPALCLRFTESISKVR